MTSKDNPYFARGIVNRVWAFYLGNLKSAAMKGPDLRTKDPKVSWTDGFLD